MAIGILPEEFYNLKNLERLFLTKTSINGVQLDELRKRLKNVTIITK